MSEIYFREFYRMQDEINERDQKIAELQTELSNEEWINEQSRKEIDRLNEQIKSAYIGDEQVLTAELRLDLAKARAEIHRLNGLLDKRKESAYTAMSEREKVSDLHSQLYDLSGLLRKRTEQRDDIQKKHDELINRLEELVKENDEY